MGAGSVEGEAREAPAAPDSAGGTATPGPPSAEAAAVPTEPGAGEESGRRPARQEEPQAAVPPADLQSAADSRASLQVQPCLRHAAPMMCMPVFPLRHMHRTTSIGRCLRSDCHMIITLKNMTMVLGQSECVRLLTLRCVCGARMCVRAILHRKLPQHLRSCRAALLPPVRRRRQPGRLRCAELSRLCLPHSAHCRYIQIMSC